MVTMRTRLEHSIKISVGCKTGTSLHQSLIPPCRHHAARLGSRRPGSTAYAAIQRSTNRRTGCYHLHVQPDTRSYLAHHIMGRRVDATHLSVCFTCIKINLTQHSSVTSSRSVLRIQWSCCRLWCNTRRRLTIRRPRSHHGRLYRQRESILLY